jgi:hypothetical protein
MRIRELAQVTGVQIAHIKDMRQRGILPFETVSVEVKDATGRVWSNYSVHDAMYLIAAQTLFASQGIAWAEASKMLRARAIHLPESGGRYRTPNFHCVRVTYLTASGNAPSLGAETEVYRGTLAGVMAAIERAVTARNARTHFPSDLISAGSIAAVNLSHAYATAQGRAAAEGIEVDADLSPEPGDDE